MNLAAELSAWRARTALAFFVFGVSVAQADSFFPRAEEWLEAQPKQAIKIDDLATTLPTPEKAFAFIRDRIAYEPYAGSMKGAAGALITSGANDVDRCLLLARLLNAQGVESHLVIGSLDDAQCQKLLAQVQHEASAASRMISTLSALHQNMDDVVESPAPNENPGLTPAFVAQQLRHRAADRAGLFRLDEQAGWSDLSGLVKMTTLAPISLPTDHVWLRATIGDKTVDLDPSFSDAAFGRRIGTEREMIDADAVPERFGQTVTVKVVADFLINNAVVRRELLTQTLQSMDLLTTGFRVSILPKTAPGQLGDFQPLLLVGDQITKGGAFRLHGAPAPEKKAAEPAGAGGLLGGFGGGGDQPETPAPVVDPTMANANLGRVAFEFVFHGPDRSDETVSRVILDRLAQERETWRIVDAFSNEEKTRPLLMQTWDGAVDIGAPHPLAVFQNQVDALKALDPMRTAIAEAHALNPSDLPALVPAPQLEGFFLASGLRREALRAQGFPNVRDFYARPRVALLRHGFTVTDWTATGDSPARYAEGIDLLNHPVQFVGEKAAEAALRSGIADTAIEQYALNTRARMNTLPLFVAAHEQKISLLMLANADDVRKIDVPAAIRAAVARDLRAGRRVLAPAQMVRFEQGHIYGWWSLDPKTGYTIGKMDLGGAQGLVEASEINERITEWTEAYVKFLGNVLKCYQGALEDALGSVKPNYKNLSVDVTINHGQDPSPSEQVLIGCLKDAACDALKDFVATELNSVACFQETKEIEDLLLAWEEQQVLGAGSDAAGKICQKALGG